MSENTKFTAGQLLSLQAKMSVIPGGVDCDATIKRFSRNDGETSLDEGTPVTFVGYEKLTISGKNKRQPVVTALIDGESIRVWAYRDHLVDGGAGVDRRAYLTSRIAGLSAELLAAEDELENLPEDEEGQAPEDGDSDQDNEDATL